MQLQPGKKKTVYRKFAQLYTSQVAISVASGMAQRKCNAALDASMGENEAGDKKGGPKAAFQRGLRWDLRLARRGRGHRKLDRRRLLEVVRSGDGEGNVVDPGWRQNGRFGIAATAATAHAARCSLLHCSRAEDVQGNIKPDPGLALLFGGKRW